MSNMEKENINDTDSSSSITEIINQTDDGVKCFKSETDIYTKLYYKLICLYLKQKQKYKISRVKICQKTKLSNTAVYKIDTFQSIPQIDTLLKLFDAVDCELNIQIIDRNTKVCSEVSSNMH